MQSLRTAPAGEIGELELVSPRGRGQLAIPLARHVPQIFPHQIMQILVNIALLKQQYEV